MVPDEYIRTVLRRHELPMGPDSPAGIAFEALKRPAKEWAGRYLLDVTLTGSYAKGTRILGSTDLDILISVGPRTPMDMEKLYEHFFAWLKRNRFDPKRKNVSVGLQRHGVSVDLIPAKQEWGSSNNHQIYETIRRRTISTNLDVHVKYVLDSGRVAEIRAIKLWAHLRNLRFPAFCLELAVIDALRHRARDLLTGNVELSLKYLRDVFPGVPFRDPANPQNRASDDLMEHEKLAIADAAKETLLLRDWAKIIW
jgi:hypothetical protein